jgi:hypothetical protein
VHAIACLVMAVVPWVLVFCTELITSNVCQLFEINDSAQAPAPTAEELQLQACVL